MYSQETTWFIVGSHERSMSQLFELLVFSSKFYYLSKHTYSLENSFAALRDSCFMLYVTQFYDIPCIGNGNSSKNPFSIFIMHCPRQIEEDDLVTTRSLENKGAGVHSSSWFWIAMVLVIACGVGCGLSWSKRTRLFDWLFSAEFLIWHFITNQQLW